MVSRRFRANRVHEADACAAPNSCLGGLIGYGCQWEGLDGGVVPLVHALGRIVRKSSSSVAVHLGALGESRSCAARASGLSQEASEGRTQPSVQYTRQTSTNDFSSPQLSASSPPSTSANRASEKSDDGQRTFPQFPAQHTAKLTQTLAPEINPSSCSGKPPLPALSTPGPHSSSPALAPTFPFLLGMILFLAPLPMSKRCVSNSRRARVRDRRRV